MIEWMPVFFGIWLAGVFLGLGLHVRLWRYCAVGALAMAAGPLIALLPLTAKLANIGLFFAAVGAVLLICGIVTFVRYLREFPLPAEGAGDGID